MQKDRIKEFDYRGKTPDQIREAVGKAARNRWKLRIKVPKT